VIKKVNGNCPMIFLKMMIEYSDGQHWVYR